MSLLVLLSLLVAATAMPVEFMNLTISPNDDPRIQLVDDGTFSLLPAVRIPVRFVVFLPAMATPGGAVEVTDAEALAQLGVANQLFSASGLGNVTFSLHSVANVRGDTNALKSCNTNACQSSSSSSTSRRRPAATAAAPPLCPFYADTIPRYQAPTQPQDVINVFVCPNILYDGESQFPWEQRPSDYVLSTAEGLNYTGPQDTARVPAYIQLRLGAFLNHGNGTARDGGKSLVHELGHFFGLLHVFDNGGGVWAACDPAFGDFVADTPPTAFGADPKALVCLNTSGCNPNQPRDVGNIMDESRDSCLTHFTPLQAQRMARMLRAFRPKLVIASRADGVRTTTVRGGASVVNPGASVLPPMRLGNYFIALFVPGYFLLLYCYVRRTRRRILVPGRDL